MARSRVHHHPCQRCGAPVECVGKWEENYDGFPEAICADFHLPNGGENPHCLCDDCEDCDATRARAVARHGDGAHDGR